jgi:HK97 family phage major capsid protein
MNIGTPANGGYAVPVLVDPTIIWTAQGSPNDIINLARVERITNDRWRGLTSAGMTWSFKAEGAPSTDNSPTIAEPEVPTYRADGFIPYTLEVEMDWPSFASDMATAMEAGYAELLAQSLTTGTGVTQPKGIITALNAAAGSKVQVATSATLVPNDVYGLWKSLPIKWRRKDTVAWMSHTGIEQKIRQFGAGASADANFTVNMNSEKINPLFNRSYYENDFMADMPTGVTTDPLLVVGDWQQYLVAQRMGMTVERLQMLFDPATGNPTGKRGMVGYARVGADCLVTNAFRLLINK